VRAHLHSAIEFVTRPARVRSCNVYTGPPSNRLVQNRHHRAQRVCLGRPRYSLHGQSRQPYPRRHPGLVFSQHSSYRWLTDNAILLQTQAVYFPPLYACAALNTVASRVNMWVALSFDTVCLFVLLGALWREPGGNFWRFLFKQVREAHNGVRIFSRLEQGFIYFVIVTSSYLVCAVRLIR